MTEHEAEEWVDNLLANTNGLRSSFAANSAPTQPAEGSRWLDTSDTEPVLREYQTRDDQVRCWVEIARGTEERDAAFPGWNANWQAWPA